MKNYQTGNIRNIALIGSSRSGKTTLAETMLYEGKVIDRRGSVEAKTTISDNTDIEQDLQRSVYASPMYAEFQDCKINFMDTPGADDYIGAVASAFRVADSGIMLVNAQQGVEVGTEIFGDYAEKHQKPLIIAVNQLDTEKANWESTIDSLKNWFGGKVAVCQFPVEVGPGFKAIVDVLKMKMYSYKDENGTVEESEIPANLKSEAEDLQAELMEKAAENDEALMEKFFDAGELSHEEMVKGISLGFLSCGLMPVFCLAGRKDIGVRRLMEFVLHVAPKPSDIKEKTKDGKEIACEASGTTAIFIYKNAVEQNLGDVSYFKVVSGKLTEGMDLVNPENGNKERISAIYAVAGKKREKVSELSAGDWGCTVKLKSVKSNQTYVAGGADYVFAPVDYPQAKYRTAIKAVDEKCEEKLGEILQRFASEDPSFQVRYARELKQTILSGMGERHISTIKWYLTNVYKIEAEFFAPRISYRETITKVATANYRHKKQSGGSGQFGEVHLLVEPIVEGVEQSNRFMIGGKEMVLTIKGKEDYTMDWGGKLEYYNCIVGGAIDARFMPAILKGIMEKMEEGPLTGSYARDIRVYIYDGKMHPVDSNEISFKLAARNAFKEAFRNAGPKIMEPMCDMEILTPGDNMGDVMSDLNGRRAMIEGMSSGKKGMQVLKARVPLAELYKYSTTLSSLTSGRATFTMKEAPYQQVPADVQDKLLKAYQEEDKDE